MIVGLVKARNAAVRSQVKCDSVSLINRTKQPGTLRAIGRWVFSLPAGFPGRLDDMAPSSESSFDARVSHYRTHRIACEISAHTPRYQRNIFTSHSPSNGSTPRRYQERATADPAYLHEVAGHQRPIPGEPRAQRHTDSVGPLASFALHRRRLGPTGCVHTTSETPTC